MPTIEVLKDIVSALFIGIMLNKSPPYFPFNYLTSTIVSDGTTMVSPGFS